MSLISDAYSSIASLNLWFKVQAADRLQLADIPELIPYRWAYFRDNWEFIKPLMIERTKTYQFSSVLTQQITDFSKFIESQRSSNSRTNPFSDAQIPQRFFAIFENADVDVIPVSQLEQAIIDKNTSLSSEAIREERLP
jgi:hypothetical protein